MMLFCASVKQLRSEMLVRIKSIENDDDNDATESDVKVLPKSAAQAT
jgi:hypothetical protein